MDFIQLTKDILWLVAESTFVILGTAVLAHVILFYVVVPVVELVRWLFNPKV